MSDLNQSFRVVQEERRKEEDDIEEQIAEYCLPKTKGLTAEAQMEEMSAAIERELASMPQKLDECVEDGMEHLKIQEHADKVIQCIKEDVVTEQEAEFIQQKEMVAPELLPAINDPSEVQDLRMLNEADKHDLDDWVETANEIMPVWNPE